MTLFKFPGAYPGALARRGYPGLPRRPFFSSVLLGSPGVFRVRLPVPFSPLGEIGHRSQGWAPAATAGRCLLTRAPRSWVAPVSTRGSGARSFRRLGRYGWSWSQESASSPSAPAHPALFQDEEQRRTPDGPCRGVEILGTHRLPAAFCAPFWGGGGGSRLGAAWDGMRARPGSRGFPCVSFSFQQGKHPAGLAVSSDGFKLFPPSGRRPDRGRASGARPHF